MFEQLNFFVVVQILKDFLLEVCGEKVENDKEKADDELKMLEVCEFVRLSF
jgi:hypothetical protein